MVSVAADKRADQELVFSNPRSDLTYRASGITLSTALDAGMLPVEELVEYAWREGRRPKPIYQAHRWFARRFGSAFRALLTAAAIAPGDDFWAAYERGVDWSGRTVLDPFVGGGTSVVEARALGANVIGIDVDAVACAITRFELGAAETPDLDIALTTLKNQIGRDLQPFYQTVTPDGETRDVLHYFWVQVLDCRVCGRSIEAHPHYQLAYEAQGKRQWAFCRTCHAVADLDRARTRLSCRQCSARSQIQSGTVRYGTVTCPHCRHSERLIDVASRTGQPPQWRLFALETVSPADNARSVPMAQRHFQAATEHDHAVFASAVLALEGSRDANGSIPWIPDRRVPCEGRADDRLPRYGYERYRDLFNPRQSLHLSRLAKAIVALDAPVREALALAFSDHLATNCMMTHYAFGWRRLAPLFSVRAFCHVPRPVEINPWLDKTGRGTFPNAVHQIQRSIEDARRFYGVAGPDPRSTPSSPSVTIVQGTALDLKGIDDATVDLVLTDPPYFDNIAYSELSDFYLPWIDMLGLIPEGSDGDRGLRDTLAAARRDEATARTFEVGLRHCFDHVARVLKPGGRLAFTYQHITARAWSALAAALADSGLRPVQVFPLLGNTTAGPHVHDGTIAWDAVFVAARMPEGACHPPTPLVVAHGAREQALQHYQTWATRLENIVHGRFSAADRQNFYRACLVAAALGLFSHNETNAVGDNAFESLTVALDAQAPISGA